MSKRKNPLQNLDDFLKQEASSLVTPKKFTEPKPEPLKENTPALKPAPGPVNQEEVNLEQIASMLQKLANKNNLTNKQQLFELIKFVLEENGLENSKDKMLINTVLYLQHGERWKEEVAGYWKKAAV